MLILTEGPSGGAGGFLFNDLDDQLGGPGPSGFASTASIFRLEVNAGDTLDHLQVTYQIAGASTIGPIQHGASNGGEPFPAFDLVLSQGEKLRRIDGSLDIFDGTLEVRGLQFTTTSGRQSDVFGAFTGERFVYEAPPNGEIIALWGRQGFFLDALGVFVRVP